MKARSIRIWLVGLVTVFALLQVPRLASAVDLCAFEDVNDNGVFDGGDVIVPNALWIGGAPFVTANPFVVPVGCDNTLLAGPAITNGVSVTAAKITFLARLDYFPQGGRGIVFISNGDLIVGNGTNQALIRAGGHNTLAATEIAVFRRSVALVGAGDCTFNFAEILGTAPIQDTQIGIRCTGDLTFQNTRVVGSKVNIQSLTGEINASGSGGGGGGLLSLVALCDNPATNLTGNGNQNNIADAPDFPCSLNLGAVVNLANLASLNAACQPFNVVAGNNVFHAFNDPLIMIAGAGAGNNLDVQGASIVGRYRVTLAAEDGNLNTRDAIIDHGEQLGLTPPGGAKIWLFADPTSVVRLPVDREDFFGPSAGSSNILNACYRSPNPVQVGRDGGGAINLLGAPAPPPCLQLVDFVPVLNGIF